eukprot:319224_1
MASSASILSHPRRHTCCEQILRRAKRGMSERLLPTAVIPVTASTNNRGGRGGDKGTDGGIVVGDLPPSPLPEGEGTTVWGGGGRGRILMTASRVRRSAPSASPLYASGCRTSSSDDKRRQSRIPRKGVAT